MNYSAQYAAVRFLNNGDQVTRIYTVDEHGGLHEYSTDDPHTEAPATDLTWDNMTAPQPNSSVMAVRAKDDATNDVVRVYYTDTNNNLIDAQFDETEGWRNGVLSTLNIGLRPGTRILYAVATDDTYRIGYWADGFAGAGGLMEAQCAIGSDDDAANWTNSNVLTAAP